MDEGTWKIMMKFFTQNQLVPVYRQKGGKQNRKILSNCGKTGENSSLKNPRNTTCVSICLVELTLVEIIFDWTKKEFKFRTTDRTEEPCGSKLMTQISLE